MMFRRPVIWLVAVGCALQGVAAHSSYVIDAEGAGIARGTITAEAGFDFVTHDFGLESKDAIQIALTNLHSASNLHGNLLAKPPEVVVVSEDAVALEEGAVAEAPPVSVDLVVLESQEDFSYYDEVTPNEDVESTGVSAYAPIVESSLPTDTRELPVIYTPTLFWVLKPAEFASFSQMMAARFGF